MKIILSITITLLGCFQLHAHDLSDPDGQGPHAHDKPPQPTQVGAPAPKSAPPQAAAFAMFAPAVNTRWDEKFLYVESNGLPSHNMMVGITTWQQQVPLPQAYSGDNAWRIPLHPVPAKEPQVIEGHFLRGAIALAANGIPIFNPQNNRGEVSAEIGELDQWGGHCGRADDYHYHIAPLHLQRVLGKSKPIAWALDGYPVYGLTEPDGSPVGTLDKCHGHETPALGYHYHAATRRPYLQSAFHGEVVEREGQVDPQPRAQGVREAKPPLRGAEITAFASTGANSYKLDYTVNGDKRSISYSSNPDGTYPFVFDNGSDGTMNEVYSQRAGGGQRDKGGPGKDRRPSENPPPADEGKRPQAAVRTASASSSFTLRSPDVENGGALPIDYTGDGSGATLPLEWSGAPAGTKNYALIMHHLDPEGATKGYWTLYDIPANITGLPKNVKGIGKIGIGFKGQVGYEPPHSKGPGAKTYTLTLYALSAPAKITVPPSQVNHEVLLAAIQRSILASSDLNVVYTRNGTDGDSPPENRPRPPRQEGGPGQTPPRTAPSSSPPPNGGKGGADNQGLVKPAITDTIQASIYADNWFKLYINGKLVAVDPIDFLPHNVVNLEILPEYPMTIAVMAMDNANPKTGMEYGNHIGDGGFIIKFSDGTISNAKWKAKSFFKGPLNHETSNPKVEHTPIPANWFAVNFDDSKWPNATEYTEQRVNPKEPFYKADFAGAKFIWTEDLDLDNTILFRAKIDKPGWKPRWNTKPDLDVIEAQPH
ncbi:MAG: YHYH protein [Akkermansiaceae bacterium]|nr:YHYH protein [Akkermansiaceae bacterium]